MILALILHGFLFSIDWESSNNRINRITEPDTLAISLHYLEPEKPVQIIPIEPQDSVLPEIEPSPPPPPAPKTVKEKTVKKPEFIQPAIIPKKERIRETKKILQEEISSEKTQEERPPLPINNILSTDSDNFPLKKESSVPDKEVKIAGNIKEEESIPPPPVIKLAIPAYKDNPAPKYPGNAERRGLEGVVILDVFVDEDGKVQELHVGESSGHTILDNAAMDAVRKWVFIPGTRNNDPVAVWVKVPIRFQIN